MNVVKSYHRTNGYLREGFAASNHGSICLVGLPLYLPHMTGGGFLGSGFLAYFHLPHMTKVCFTPAYQMVSGGVSAREVSGMQYC